MRGPLVAAQSGVASTTGSGVGEASAAAGRRLIGVTTVEPEAGLLSQLGLPVGSVLQVREVRAGGPAESAGLRVHDLVVAVDGQRPVTQDSLRAAIQGHATGEFVVLTLRRAQQTLELPVEVHEEASVGALTASPSERGAEPWRNAWTERLRAQELEAQLSAAVAQLDAERSTLEAAQMALEQGHAQQRQSLEDLAALGYLKASVESLETQARKAAERDARRAEVAAEVSARSDGERPAGELEPAGRAVAEEVATSEGLKARLDAARREVEVAEAALEQARHRQGERSSALAALEGALARQQMANEQASRYVDFIDSNDERDALLMLLGQRAAGEEAPELARLEVLAEREAGLREKRSLEALLQAQAYGKAAAGAAAATDAAAAASLDGRIDALEQRLSRIEALLEQLAATR